MKSELTPATGSIQGVSWDVLGQTYVPKSYCESSMGWHATLPKGTFVPPHIHPEQDEFVYILSGELEYMLDGQEGVAKPGDTLCMPKRIVHGLFNRTDTDVTALFWVSPSDRLWTLFSILDGMKDPEQVVAESAKYGVEFLPAPAD